MSKPVERLGNEILKTLIERAPDQQFVLIDGFNDAVMGSTTEGVLIYSATLCINILEEQMEKKEAFDYFYFNILGAHFGENSPIFCIDF